jgi:CheY-like chemotaxis protein
MPPVRVFLSYRRSDTAAVAHAVRYALLNGGHTVFLDTADVDTGDAFRDVIRDELANAGLVLFLVGPGFAPERLHRAGDVVRFEWMQARFFGCGIQLVLVDDARVPAAADLPPDLRWIAERNASRLVLDTLGQDIDALVEAVPRLAATPRSSRVLWVDDHPANNEWERRHLRTEGILFDNVVSTIEAIEQLSFSRYDLVITDLGRLGSSDRSRAAGTDLLSHPVLREGGPPVIVYATWKAAARADALKARGAFGVAASQDDLYRLVRLALSRPEA